MTCCSAVRNCFHRATALWRRGSTTPTRGVVVNFADQMRQHFGVRFGSEMVLTLPQISSSLICAVVLDHAVVDERKFTALIEMRMRVLIGRLAVGRPTRVTDAIGPGRRRVSAINFASPAMRPAHLRVSTWSPSTIATPAES